MRLFIFFVIYCFAISLICGTPLFLAELCYVDWKEKKDAFMRGRKKTDVLFDFCKDFFDGCKNIALALGLLIVCSPKNLTVLNHNVVLVLIVINIVIFGLPFVVWGRKVSIALNVKNEVITILFGMLSICILFIFFKSHSEITKSTLYGLPGYISDDIFYLKEYFRNLWG